MDNTVIKQPEIAEQTYTHNQVEEMLLTAHACGWNNGVSKRTLWSDTSLDLLKAKLLLIFKFKM